MRLFTERRIAEILEESEAAAEVIDKEQRVSCPRFINALLSTFCHFVGQSRLYILRIIPLKKKEDQLIQLIK